MSDRRARAVAVVGVGALLPDAPDAPSFWKNLCERRYSITDVPPERWSVDEYYDPDPAAPDKTYSKIGGWVRGYSFDWQRYKIPPRVVGAMDQGQQWAVTIAAQALARLRAPRPRARPRAHRRRPRRGDRRRAAVPDGPAHVVPGVPAEARGGRGVLGASVRPPPHDRRALAGGRAHDPAPDQRGHDAGRAREHHRRARRERPQPPRAELHDRCGVRLEPGRPRGGDEPAAWTTTATR